MPGDLVLAIVGDPGNPSVGVIQRFGVAGKGQTVEPPKGTGIYKSCSGGPQSPESCLTVSGVGCTCGIGEFDVAVSQYVTFLDTAGPRGWNTLQLYFDDMSLVVWPKYGSVSYTPGARLGQHYWVAYREWAGKPFGFGGFSRAARFANSLTNGKVLSRTQSASLGLEYVTCQVRLWPDTGRGRYGVANPAATRAKSTGFVIPGNNEWVMAACYDPQGGGTGSYWAYPAGLFSQPDIAVLNPGNGNTGNASGQPLPACNPNDPDASVDTPGAPPGEAPDWCPSQAGSSCGDLAADFPRGLDLQKNCMANVSTAGQDGTPSPWGSYDQGSNVVEILDTAAPQPPGCNFLRDWHYCHGGVANAPGCQLEISAFGYFPGDTAFLRAYPWIGCRVGVIGTP